MRFFYLLLLALVVSTASSDGKTFLPLLPDSTTAPSYPAALYLHAADTYATLFTGREHEKYPMHYTNHPWLKSPGYSPGILYKEGLTYPDVLMKLDLFRNELVITPRNAPFNVVSMADSARLHGFNIHLLSNAAAGSPGGYGIVLYNGKNKLYLKYELILRRMAESGRVIQRFETLSTYWLFVNNQFYKITRPSDLYGHFQTDHHALRHFLKEQHLSFRKNPEATLTGLMIFLERP